MQKHILTRIPMWANKKKKFFKKHIGIFLGPDGRTGPEDPLQFMWPGTNGKGSVCAFMTSVLKSRISLPGTFISPFGGNTGTLLYKMATSGKGNL